jgi:membrane-bound lytic murein transglycosylase B
MRRTEGQRRLVLWSGLLVLVLMAAVALGLPKQADAAMAKLRLEQPSGTSVGTGWSGAPPRSQADGAEDQASAIRALYQRAAQRYGLSPGLLRALHAVESNELAGGCLENSEGSGAVGPLQFKPATFGQYGVDADGDGRADICNLADALESAAHYLVALGAEPDPGSPATRNALVRYGTDPERVTNLALALG